MISIECKKCGKNFAIETEPTEKHIQCPDCQTILPIPDSDQEETVSSAQADPLQAATITHDNRPSSSPSDGESESASEESHVAGSIEIPGYEIISEIGRGGMGVVYKARHLKLNRIVALKMILAGAHAGPQDVQRFLSEAEAVAAFQHPNIVQVYEIGEHQGLPYMALEYVDGGSLATRLREGPLPPKAAAKLVEQIARGMNAAHQSGIVHRDLKPANVLLQNAEVRMQNEKVDDSAFCNLNSAIPKVTDFGLAKKVEGGDGLTHTGAIMGTPSYMAPEQASGDGKRVGPAADVYALGAVLYACLTGRPPFRAGNVMDTVMLVLNDEAVPPSRLSGRIPADLETICLKCLQKDRLKRYASAHDLAEDLRCWRVGEPIAARPVGRVERSVKWVRRNAVVASLLFVIMVALLGGAGASTWFGIQAQSNATEAAQKAEAEKKSPKSR